MLRLVASFDELAASPIGCALAGASFVAWCATPRLTGTVHFGRRDTRDADTLTRLYGLAAHRSLRRPLRRVVDGRDLHNVDDDAWAQMSATLLAQGRPREGMFERQAVIVAPTVEGVRTSALLPAFGPNDAYRVFVDAAEAYAWADPTDGPAAHDAVEALRAEVGVAGTLVVKARAWIAAHLRQARIEPCAAALGVSPRSLQRGFTTAGQTFRGVVTAERVAAARAQLLEGDAKIESIARAVGCSSASQLGVLMRRAGLGPPSRVRAARTTRGRDRSA